MRLTSPLALLAPAASAQLAGGYGVGVGQNFETIADAAKELDLYGANGNVTFCLTDASYDEVFRSNTFLYGYRGTEPYDALVRSR